jgi:Uma2 family endonuclease
MTSARRLHYTYREYLEVERRSDVKHEFLDGEIYAMAGGSPEHSLLATQLTTLLRSRLTSGCHVGNSDLKVNILATGLSTYPDGSVICGALERDPRDELAITNPILLLEVTSPSTEDYDRGDKLSHYKQLPSLQVVVIASHQSKRLTVVTRTTTGWATTDVRGGERVTLAAPALELTVDEVYAVLDGVR